jgi:hypothetical protein
MIPALVSLEAVIDRTDEYEPTIEEIKSSGIYKAVEDIQS